VERKIRPRYDLSSEVAKYCVWIVDAPPGIVFRWKRYVDRIIRPPDYLPMEISNVFCVDGRCPAWHSVWTDALCGQDSSTSGLPSNRNE